MAAAGGGGLGTGGKIRSRRYHLSSGRAPYTKNRQQNQQGIIGRVKDTVKSIVPVWLQKYFNNVDEAHEVSPHTNEPEEHVDIQNDVENDHFADQERLPLFGRAAPEPVKIQSDPATNQVMMNSPDVLTRPSLHRANLNIVLDSPALNCQPSTSGFSLVKEIKDSASLHDDDNISTTSGFSSRASDKDVAITRTGNAPILWSPEAERTHDVSQNSSFNSKKPTFNPSSFSSFLPNSSRLGDSPFYPGKTTYGGASAACQSRVRSTPYRVPVKKQVVAKPAHATYGVTSLAARRILQSLEKMSSPLADAKRIPSVPFVSPSAAERSFSGESSSKRKKVDSSLPPVQKLVTPQSISVPSSLRKIRPSLSSTLSNASSCRTQSSDKHKAKGNYEPATPLQQTSFVILSNSLSYPTFSTPASNGFASGRGGGKMMRERGSTKPSEEEVEVPILPAVPLPISMTALPKFSLNMEQKTSPLPVRQPVSTKVNSTTSTDATGFNFSQPVVKAIRPSEEPTTSPVGFTFRAPALKTTLPHENTKSMLNNTEITLKVKAPILMNSSSAKKAEEEVVCKPAQSLKEGSVLDILRSPGFQSTSSQQTRTTPAKSAVSSPKPLMFGQSSKQALGIWYCDCCLVENKASDSKCVCCSTVKDQATEVTKQPTTLAPTTAFKNTSPLKCVQGFGDMFKAAPGTWDCDTCLVQNKSESSKCVACASPKPGTGAKDPLLVLPTTKPDMLVAPPDNGLTLSPSLKFEELARKPIGSWECTVCCVQNKAEDSSCVACTSPKPGVSTTLPATSFPASLPASQAEPQGFGKSSFSSEPSFPPVKFGLPPSSETGEQKSSSSTDSSSNTNKTGFSFTFGQSSKTLDEKKDKDVTFGTATSNTVSAPFKFGFTSSAPAEKDGAAKPLTTDFQFGTKPESSSNASLLGLSAKEKSDITPTFGLKKPEEKKTDTPVAGGFTFGKVDQKESALPFAFGKNDEKTESTPTVTSSLFGSKSDADQPKSFVFGKPEAGKADASELSSFAFGAPNPTEKKEADQPAKPVFSFGSSATETGSSKPVFGFPGSGSSSAPQSSNIGSSTSVFGSVPQTSSSNVFASAVQSNTAAPAAGSPAPSSTVFSSSTSLTVPTGPSNVFGAALSSNTPAGSSGIFGSAPASGTTTSSSIVFGSVASVNTSSSSNVFGSAAPTNTSATSNTLFGNSSTSTNPSSVPFVFGQPATTAGGAMFGSSNESKSTFAFAGQENKPAETSASAAPAAPFLFGAGTSTPAATGFSFGGTNTSNSTGTSSTPFIFGVNQSAPAAPGLAAATSVPTFGKTVAQTNAPAFGAPVSGFPSGSQTAPSFGSMSSTVQPPGFGQQSTQPTFGANAAPPAGGSFQFGGANFNFGGASSTGVFTFGSNSGANPAQPGNSSFAFNQTPSFNMGSNGKTLTPSSISNRKIKTARRRK
ncbi:PREDICTED: nuclear pore complex protein Nup153 [Nanorana parkeri]|uniref:nuclear pore complex protein Nup153 n=1 Tax=Nanorana parkeri TaxID=125878 RepID=UPI000854D46C|nr:PREDICTED: nuclear pore complex protein Nup153 [Nanorana parkeri]